MSEEYITLQDKKVQVRKAERPYQDTESGSDTKGISGLTRFDHQLNYILVAFYSQGSVQEVCFLYKLINTQYQYSLKSFFRVSSAPSLTVSS